MFGDSSSSSSHEACPYHDLTENASQDFVGSLSFYQFDKILAASCTAFSCIVIVIHLCSHAFRFSNPGEQSKIMKVAVLVPLWSVFSLLSIIHPQAQVYLFPWLDLFQANALAAFFLLVCDYISPSSGQRELFFVGMTISKNKRQKKKGKGKNGLQWYLSRWLFIFQYPVVSLGVAIATDATQAEGVYCEYLTKPYYAKIWLNIIHEVSLVLAVLTVVRFTFQLKSRLAQHNIVRKLVSLKVIVFLGFIQQIVFWVLQATNSLNPTSTLTYADLNIGMPSLLTCLEMVPISLFMAYSYPVRPYLIRDSGDREQKIDEVAKSYKGGFLGWKAFLAMINPWELIRGIGFAVKVTIEGKSKRSNSAYQGATHYHNNPEQYGQYIAPQPYEQYSPPQQYQQYAPNQQYQQNAPNQQYQQNAPPQQYRQQRPRRS